MQLSSPSTSNVSNALPRYSECNYDVNPTELFQAIEEKQWKYVCEMFDENPDVAEKEVATWVTRREKNGNLRWRLLPLHAAIIFQSPPSIVERLLQECPHAAQAKDDQGMVPLHLAFRTKVTCWETVEELLTVHPRAIFARDRKGRTPLECGVAASTVTLKLAQSKTKNMSETDPSGASTFGMLMGGGNASTGSTGNAESTAKTKGGAPFNPQLQKSIFSILELYTHALKSNGESQMQKSLKMKEDLEKEKTAMTNHMLACHEEMQSLRQEIQRQRKVIDNQQKNEHELVAKLQHVTVALKDQVHQKLATEEKAVKKQSQLQKTNNELLLLSQALMRKQTALRTSLSDMHMENQQLKIELQAKTCPAEGFASVPSSFPAECPTYVPADAPQEGRTIALAARPKEDPTVSPTAAPASVPAVLLSEGHTTVSAAVPTNASTAVLTTEGPTAAVITVATERATFGPPVTVSTAGSATVSMERPKECKQMTVSSRWKKSHFYDLEDLEETNDYLSMEYTGGEESSRHRRSQSCYQSAIAPKGHFNIFCQPPQQNTRRFTLDDSVVGHYHSRSSSCGNVIFPNSNNCQADEIRQPFTRIDNRENENSNNNEDKPDKMNILYHHDNRNTNYAMPNMQSASIRVV